MANDNIERAKSRLDNIQAIEPLLGALRTMSMGAWQLALRKIAQIKHYEEQFDHILFEILPEIDPTGKRKPEKPSDASEIADTIILIIGSERGLCGKFNKIMIEKMLDFIESNNLKSYKIWAMGSRMIRDLERKGIQISWRKPLPPNTLVSFQDAYIKTQSWLGQYESFEFNSLIILYNQIAKGGINQFTSFKLLPYEIQDSLSPQTNENIHWPPPILETSPVGIYKQIIQQLLASSFYQILLKATAAEHSARFHLMEEAKNNAQDILEELNTFINSERKKRITQEMQELATGAGLLGKK